MPVTQGKDTMYGGSLITPANSPNDILISGNGTFSFNTWKGSILAGGNVQLYIRKWTFDGTNWNGSTVFYGCWDGQSVWIYSGSGWTLQGSIGGNTTWSDSNFYVNTTTRWSVIPQTGPVGDATDQSFTTPITIVPGSIVSGKQPFTTTLASVNNGGGTGNIVITIDVQNDVR